MANRKVHKFGFDGRAIDVETIVAKHQEWTRQFINSLRDRGYVPLLDIDPAVSMWYDEPTETFEFTVTVKAIYVGKKKAWQIEGISEDKLIPRPIARSKPGQ